MFLWKSKARSRVKRLFTKARAVWGMAMRHRYSDAAYWLEDVFNAKAARTGGVVRRACGWVEREIGRDLFLASARERGFHVIEGGGQFIVICTKAPIRVLF
jgi:hypothetical protein